MRGVLAQRPRSPSPADDLEDEVHDRTLLPLRSRAGHEGGRRTRIIVDDDARGMEYLALLLRHPGEEIHVTDLAGGRAADRSTAEPGLRVRGFVDDGSAPRADAAARSRYRRRLLELRDEHREAEHRNDLGRLAGLRHERDMLEREITASFATAHGGTHIERARVAVSKALGTALIRIAAACPPLGAHFGATIRRGYFCAYRPDPRHPIAWEL